MKQKIVISENLKPIEKWVLSFVVPKILKEIEEKINSVAESVTALGYPKTEQTLLICIDGEITSESLYTRDTDLHIETAHFKKYVAYYSYKTIKFIDELYTKETNEIGEKYAEIAKNVLKAQAEAGERLRLQNLIVNRDHVIQGLECENEQLRKQIQALKVYAKKFVLQATDEELYELKLAKNPEEEDLDNCVSDAQLEALEKLGL